MMLIDIVFFVGFAFLIFFGYDVIKLIVKKWLPKGSSFNEAVHGFSDIAEGDRITPQMVALKAIVDGKSGGSLI